MFETLFKYPFGEFVKGTIKLASGLRPELAVLGVIVAAVLAWFFYRRVPDSVPRTTRILLSALRGLALAALVVILFQPVLETALPVTKDCFLAVLVDDSRSMRVEDAGAQGARTDKAQRKSRLSAAKELLGAPAQLDPQAQPGVLERLSEICPVQVFKFSAEADRVKTINEVTAGGERTNLYNALKTVDTELRGVPLVGVVLLSDGAHNYGGEPQEMAQAMKMRNTPIYCVGFGDPNPPKDYEVMRVQAPREVGSNTSVEIFATVRASGLTEPFEVALRQGDKVLDSTKVTLEEGRDIERVKFSFKPESKGTFRFTVAIPPHAEEVILDNNRSDFLVSVVDKRLPVLYLEGSPREEYRFLRRALFRDKDFRIASILRTEGPKKFILQGAEDEDGLKEGYPKTKEHLYRFEAIIFGDIEAGYLTKEQLDITEAFVKERGGGFMMLGGVNSFNLGKYQGTGIEKMLPILLPDPSSAYQQREFSIRLTEAGERHPVMMQNSNLLFNRNIWSKAPTLIGMNPVTEDKLKPAAQVLAAEPRPDGKTNPILVVQPYGAGRSGAFLSGGSWHWRMAVPVEDELHEKFWKQLVRWLAVGSKAKISIELDKDLFARKEPVAIRTVVLDKMLTPVNNATVVARIEPPPGAGPPIELPQEWMLSRDGVYQTQYEPTEAGDYKIEVVAKFKEGGEDAKATASFSVGETLDEFNDAGQKIALLEDLARTSGGKYLRGDEVQKLPDLLKARARELKRDETYYDRRDIWDTPLLFGIVALALSLEWFLRRRSGLM